MSLKLIKKVTKIIELENARNSPTGQWIELRSADHLNCYRHATRPLVISSARVAVPAARLSNSNGSFARSLLQHLPRGSLELRRLCRPPLWRSSCYSWIFAAPPWLALTRLLRFLITPAAPPNNSILTATDRRSGLSLNFCFFYLSDFFPDKYD